MTLSAEVRHLLLAYDSFTDFAGGPDLPWVVEVYETLDDNTVQRLIWALCYAWAVGQTAAGCYENSVGSLRQALFLKLPTWDDHWSQDEKAQWLNQLGVEMTMPEPEPRPLPVPHSSLYSQRWGDLGPAEGRTVEHMAARFNPGLAERFLLYLLSHVLRHREPAIASVPLYIDMPQQITAPNRF